MGNDSAEDALRPHLVQLSRSPSQRQQQYVRSVTAGLRHTIVLTASQQLFGWGLLHLTTTTSITSSTSSTIISSNSSTTSTSSSTTNSSVLEAQQQVSAQAPPVSFIPKNISHCVPSMLTTAVSPGHGHALSPSHVGGSDNLFLALAGSSSSSLSFMALDMCSSSRGGGGSDISNQSRRAAVGRRIEKKKVSAGSTSTAAGIATASAAVAPPIARSLSKSPVRRATGLDATAVSMAAAAAARRKDTAVMKQQKQQKQQFNTVLYKVDKPSANASQVRYLCCPLAKKLQYDCLFPHLTILYHESSYYIMNRCVESERRDHREVQADQELTGQGHHHE